MSLDASPLSPDPTPLLSPTDPAPRRGMATVGAILSVIIMAVTAFAAMRLSTPLFFLPGGINARAQAVPLTSPYRIMGFNYYWTGTLDANKGQSAFANMDTASKVMTDEQQNYHMNLVTITIVADSAGGAVNFANTNDDTYGDDVYTNLAKKAQSAHLTPVFELSLLNKDSADLSQSLIGFNKTDPAKNWDGNSGAANAEHGWFDTYTDYAVHFATLAQKLNMPFFIIGDGYYHMTDDGSNTGKGSNGAAPAKGDTFTCLGRRDCEWRHVIAAIQGSTYHHFNDDTSNKGAKYTGKLMYASTSRVPTPGGAFEWDSTRLTWWNAVDIVGIDGQIPLTKSTEPSETVLHNAWLGKGDNLVNPNTGDLVQKIWDLSHATQRPILFTSAGYESLPKSNMKPGQTVLQDDPTAPQDQSEQQTDMQVLYNTFDQYPWWLGVIWLRDYPFFPRSDLSKLPSKQYGLFLANIGLDDPNVIYNSEWGGDCFNGCATPAKKAGQWLNSINTPALPANP
jgi:hypothetical protein